MSRPFGALEIEEKLFDCVEMLFLSTKQKTTVPPCYLFLFIVFKKIINMHPPKLITFYLI